MRIITDQRGVAAVEFAIVLPVLTVLLFGMIEFSLLFYNKAMLTNACREGARSGIVFRANTDGDRDPLSPTEIKTIVLNYSGDHMINLGPGTLTDTDITIDQTSGTGSGAPLIVSATYHYDFLVLPGFVDSLIGGLDIGARSVMRME